MFSTPITYPAWQFGLFVFVATQLHWIVVAVWRRLARPSRVEAEKKVLQEAETDCPRMTTSDWTGARYVGELEAQRDYWKNSFIAFVKRAD